MAVEGQDGKAATPPANAIETPNGVVIDPSKSATADGGRPKWLPEKFKTPEDMANAYAELEKKQSTPKPDAATAADTAAANAAKAQADKAGIDMDAISNEYVETNGKLSDATMKSLADKGITKEQVNAYIGGLQAQAEKLNGELSAIAGGAEQLKSVYEWAKTNLTPAEITAYNKSLSNPDAAKMTLQGIVSRYTAATGSEPSLIDGAAAAPASGGEKPYESNAQMVRDMSNPKYKTDQAFRDQVARRLAKSTF